VDRVLEPIESAAGISRVPGAEIGMPSVVDLGDITDRAHVAAAVVAPPVWDLEAEEGSAAAVVGSVVAAAGAGDRRSELQKEITGART
jgi:hypothetical protein